MIQQFPRLRDEEVPWSAVSSQEGFLLKQPSLPGTTLALPGSFQFNKTCRSRTGQLWLSEHHYIQLQFIFFKFA